MPDTTVHLTDDQCRIVIRTPYSARFLEFVRGLPNYRWSPRTKEWTCDFTPATAWRIEQYFDGQAGVDPRIVAAAGSFKIGTQDAANARGQIALGQPRLRKTNAWGHQLVAYHFLKTLWRF